MFFEYITRTENEKENENLFESWKVVHRKAERTGGLVERKRTYSSYGEVPVMKVRFMESLLYYTILFKG